ncbi:Transferrin [Eumeta japonica]|uniref:Transferrin n=1 Tax=Eumeta variegata TaxID=151549 RepID=A0A4C1YJ08_EUMVA|nr:Transferrin [Eumeta japonica]
MTNCARISGTSTSARATTNSAAMVQIMQFTSKKCMAISSTPVECPMQCPTHFSEYLSRPSSARRLSSLRYRLDCAMKLERDEVQFAVFSQEEMMLLAQMQPYAHKVVASIRNKENREQFAFETVAVVSTSHTGGLEGLRQGGYCHTGLPPIAGRKSPRILKALEREIVRIERCSESDTRGKTFEELEVSILSKFFRAACRPGRWSLHYADDDRLSTHFLSTINEVHFFQNVNTQTYAHCAPAMGTSDCSGQNRYGGNPNVFPNDDALALDCLTELDGTVAYVVWREVSEYFLKLNQYASVKRRVLILVLLQQQKPELISNYALLCPDNTVVPLTRSILSSNLAACAWVQQPWGAVVASTHGAAGLLNEMKTWWPSGSISDSHSLWERMMFHEMVLDSYGILVYEDALPNALEYVSRSRNLADIDATSFCMPTQRWCTISEAEQRKCEWVRHALRTLGVEPALSCQQGQSPLHCLRDIQINNADFIATDSNYGYLARHVFDLSPVMMVRHFDTSMHRIAALVRSTSDVTSFESLRGKKACFSEFGGIAFLSFVATGHNKSILSTSECNYAKAVAEFFNGTCAAGALDSMHQLYNTSFDVSSLCDVCKSRYPAAGNGTEFTCKADWTNMYYGNDGALTCLADQSADVAFVDVRDLNGYF